MDLFQTLPTKSQTSSQTGFAKDEPLASRMRPRTLDEFVGQEHILKPGTLLRRMIETDTLGSIVLYGPPGTGKTTLARIVAGRTQSVMESINAVTSNVADMRKVLDRAKKNQSMGKKTILFVDEIHRFNKSQQDVLMPHVEKGNPTLIGATTHNPFFSIVAPLLSRSAVFELKTLSRESIQAVLKRALSDTERGLGKYNVRAEAKALEFLAEACEGDARRALTALEIGVLSTEPKDGEVIFDVLEAEQCVQKKAILYDRDGDGHYDTISAFIKSVRGSDPDAAIYYLAKMLYAGEDPRFIARRIVILASEDIGNADPQALVLANAALQVSEFIGLPEARITLAQATTYLACAPKSNASYLAIDKATADIKEGRVLEVPDHLKGASFKGAEKLGRTGYKYAHDYDNHYVDQTYLRETRRYYEPTDQGYEKNFKNFLENLKQATPRKPSA